MPWTPTLTELQDLLAGLYDDEAGRRRIAAEASLPIERIDFGGASVDAWHSILKAARNHDGLAALIAIARSEFERNARTSTTLDRIAAQLAADEARNDPMPRDQKVTPSAAEIAPTQAHYVAFEQDGIGEDSIAVLHYHTPSNNSAELRYISGNEPLRDIKVKISYIENIPGSIFIGYVPETAGDHKEIEIQDFYSLNDNLIGLTILNPGDGVRFYVPGKYEVVDGEIEISVSFVGARSGRHITARKILQQQVDKRWLKW